MEFIHSAPTRFLGEFLSTQKTHLLLAHLIEDDLVYRNWYQEHKIANPDHVYILSNSSFELYKQGESMYDSTKLMDIGQTAGADYIIMSDYPNEPWEMTRDATIELAPQFRKAGFGTFYCPQASIGEVNDLVRSFRWGAQSPMVDYIGVSVLAVPNAYKCEQNNKLQRFFARWNFMTRLDDEGVLDIVREQKKNIHFLGMADGPNEIMLIKPWIDIITSWNSSLAVWTGLNNSRFDDSPTGLTYGKLEKQVDFSRQFAYDSQLEAAHYNIAFINNIIEEISK